MSTSPKPKTAPAADYVVKDIGLAEWGRKEISIAETEMWDPLESTCRHASLSIL